jgi:predicted metal-dependent hydrolase
MADITRQTLTLVNVGKLAVLLVSMTGLYWGLRLDNQHLKDDIRVMINDYKSADKVHDIYISNIQDKNNEQDKSINWLTERVSGLIPEEPRSTRRRGR